jgi:hypothetical protein
MGRKSVKRVSGAKSIYSTEQGVSKKNFWRLDGWRKIGPNGGLGQPKSVKGRLKAQGLGRPPGGYFFNPISRSRSSR